MKKILLLIVFQCFIQFNFAHTDKTFSFHYNNVTVRFNTGFYYEEIEKAKMIAKATEKLAAAHGFKENILLDFIHDYAYFESKKHTFISHGIGDYKVHNGENEFSIWTDITAKFLIIEQHDSVFDIKKTLQLVEASILNFENIAAIALKPIVRGKDIYGDLISMSIPLKTIQEMTKKPLTNLGEKVLAFRIYKEETFPQKFSYYTANNEFVLFFRDKSGYEKIVDVVPDIRFIENVDETHYFVFQTWDTFSYYEKYTHKKITNLKLDSLQNTVFIYINITENTDDDSFIIKHYDFMNYPINEALFSTSQEKIIESKWSE
uniref:hypothetical protein n=1 Tax=Flavobacterium sp. TaxID=239 RepID=UPI0040496EC3